MRLGIIGLPYVGKSTVFACLTRAKAKHGHGEEARMAVVKVPDARLEKLDEMFAPGKKSYSTVEFVDFAPPAGDKKGESFSANLLAQMRVMDAFVEVVRFFEDPSVLHADGSVDPLRDVARLETELILSDLIVVENRLGRIQQMAKVGRKEGTPMERDLLQRLKETLERGGPLRNLDFNAEEEKALANFGFLSLRPLLLAMNVGEEQLSEKKRQERHRGFVENIQGKRIGFAEICGKVEEEIGELSPKEEAEFLREYGLEESGSTRLIRESYRLLGRLTFLTLGDKEVRAWTIPQGTTALKAAGTIHTDFERGFIKAEVIHFEKLVEAGSLSHARDKGWLRLEGKEYMVQEGDIVTFRFNV